MAASGDHSGTKTGLSKSPSPSSPHNCMQNTALRYGNLYAFLWTLLTRHSRLPIAGPRLVVSPGRLHLGWTMVRRQLGRICRPHGQRPSTESRRLSSTCPRPNSLETTHNSVRSILSTCISPVSSSLCALLELTLQGLCRLPCSQDKCRNTTCTSIVSSFPTRIRLEENVAEQQYQRRTKPGQRQLQGARHGSTAPATTFENV